MNKETRIQNISKIEQGSSISTEKIKWKDDSVYMNVYKIPLEFLVYNKYNGRIKSRVKSIEKYGEKIDVSVNDGKKLIEKLLWDSKPDKNIKTKIDIANNGQLKVGIITRDGIVIDGNRRTMLLNQIDKFDYFEAVILPTTIEENKREIRKLETSYQMGEDKKLDYKAIEKYLIIKDSISEGDKTEEIAEWMGEKESKIREWIDVMRTMDDYLDYFEYNGYYTQLDDREDLFITLTNWINTFCDKEGKVTKTNKVDYDYTEEDVNDLKNIAFDYIRASYEGKSFRVIAKGLKDSHFFGKEEIWKSFRDVHFEKIQPIYDSEVAINFDSPDLEKTLKSRDDEFADKTKQILDDNLKEHEQLIYNQKHKNEPEKLTNKSIDAMNVVRINKNAQNSEVIEKIEILNKITTDILHKQSPQKLLKQIFDLLSSIEVHNHFQEKEELLKYVKNIEKEAYKLEKEIKHLK